MECYVGLGEDALRKLLEQCTDFTERRRIRAAIRGVLENGSGTYSTSFDNQNNNATSYQSKTDSRTGETRDASEENSHMILEQKITSATNEDELNDLLSIATDYQDRRKIRGAIREMKNKKEEEEERLNNNNNSIKSSSRHYNSGGSSGRSKMQANSKNVNGKEKLDLDSIKDENILKQMLDETDDYDERRQIRIAMKELNKKSKEISSGYEDHYGSAVTESSSVTEKEVSVEKDNAKELEITVSKTDKEDSSESNDQDSEESEESEEILVVAKKEVIKKAAPPVKQVEKKKDNKEEEENEDTGEIDFEKIKDPEVLEKLLETSKDFGERSQIRSLLRELLKPPEVDPMPFERIKKRRLSEGFGETIWLDEIDRIHPSTSDRDVLVELEEEEDPDEYVCYDDVKDVGELQRLLEKATDIGEKRLIRSTISNLKKEQQKALMPEKCSEPGKPSGSSDASRPKDAVDTKQVKESKDVKPEATKTPAKAPEATKAPSKGLEAMKTPSKEPEATKAPSKAASLAAKFSKPTEEQPAPKKSFERKPVGSLNVTGNKFGKFSGGAADKIESSEKELSGSKTTQVAIKKTDIPGGEVVSKKTVSVSKSPDGSVTTTTTTVATSGIRSEGKSESCKGLKGCDTPKTSVVTSETKTAETTDKGVITRTIKTTTSVSTSEQKSDGFPPKKSSGISTDFLKKAEEDSKRPSPLDSSSYGIGNLKSRFQVLDGATNGSVSGSPSKFGKGSISAGKVGQFANKFESPKSSPSSSTPIVPKTTSGSSSSGCPGNGQCGTPLTGSPATSPPSTPSKKFKDIDIGIEICHGNGCPSPASKSTVGYSKKVVTKSSSCPGNGQCGTPLTGSPATSPPSTPSKKFRDIDIGIEICHGNGCPSPASKSTVGCSKKSVTKTSSCPGNGQCGTPLTGSPATSAPATPSKSASKPSEDSKFEKDICHGNGCPSPVEVEICHGNGHCPPHKTSSATSNGLIHKLGQMASRDVSAGRAKRDSNKASIGSPSSSSLTKEVSKKSEEDLEQEEEKRAYKTKGTRLENNVRSGDHSSDKMPPVVVESIEDENVLEKMLDSESDFEVRKKIRARLRDLRRKKRDDREKRVNDMENDMFRTMVETREKSKDIVMDSFKPKNTTTTQKETSSSTTTSTKSSNNNTESVKLKTEENNNTIIKLPTPSIKNASTSVDGKTITTTSTSVKEGDGSKSVTKTTVSKTEDGDTKSQSVTQENKSDYYIGGGSISSSGKTMTQTTSSSSSSTSTPGAGTARKMSKFDLQLEEKKKLRELKRIDDQSAWKEQMAKKKREEMEKRKREKEEAEKKKASIMNKFGGQATAGPALGRAGGMAKVGGVMNASTIKQKLLEWAQQVTRGYDHVNITNFSSSWCDGMAFCAVVHKFYPEAYDFDKLNPKQRRKNFDLAFNSAEKYGDIMPLLETEDMLMMKNKPDWKCVFTYVQSLYRHLSKLQQA